MTSPQTLKRPPSSIRKRADSGAPDAYALPGDEVDGARGGALRVPEIRDRRGSVAAALYAFMAAGLGLIGTAAFAGTEAGFVSILATALAGLVALALGAGAVLRALTPALAATIAASLGAALVVSGFLGAETFAPEWGRIFGGGVLLLSSFGALATIYRLSGEIDPDA